jgi:hypothetical protein
LFHCQALRSSVAAVGLSRKFGSRIELQYCGLENSCGKEGAVGAVEPGRTNREGGFLSFTSRQANNLNEYKVKKA